MGTPLQDFFYWNACNRFGFAADANGLENNRLRLQRRFSSVGLPLPDWVKGAV
jgi:hypothetical protein